MRQAKTRESDGHGQNANTATVFTGNDLHTFLEPAVVLVFSSVVREVPGYKT